MTSPSRHYPDVTSAFHKIEEAISELRTIAESNRVILSTNMVFTVDLTAKIGMIRLSKIS